MSVPSALFRELHLLPSILSADFSRLGEEVDAVLDAGVKLVHVDVMDGHFVPNLTIGPVVVASLAPRVHERGGLLSVHLMVEHPERYLQAFVAAGADALSVHVEACAHLYSTLQRIKELSASAGAALNPGTPVSRVEEVFEVVDYVLVMTVNPGFGGQELIESALQKVPGLRASLPARVAVEVDGGVHRGNIRRVAESGANWIVAGTAVFGQGDPRLQALALRALLDGEQPTGGGAG